MTVKWKDSKRKKEKVIHKNQWKLKLRENGIEFGELLTEILSIDRKMKAEVEQKKFKAKKEEKEQE